MNTCNLCPRRCNVDRSRELGWCKMDDRIHISSIILHRGEEPPISGEKGIVNVFFPSCNIQCIYCQNWQISCRGTQGKIMTLDKVCDTIIELLPLSENNLGFVSPTHFVSQMIMIVENLWRRGHNPTIVYNTNGYDLPETLRTLENIVDVWLPDFKYSDNNLAEELSKAPGYSDYALFALKEMVYQVGTTLHTDNRGIARRGIIIRHLVLPGFIENSIGILKTIANELSLNIHISLMSQYYPPDKNIRISPPEIGGGRALNPDIESQDSERPGLQGGRQEEPERGLLNQNAQSYNTAAFSSPNRTISHEEYLVVLGTFNSLGFLNGWVQAYDSHNTYRPNFNQLSPFE